MLLLLGLNRYRRGFAGDKFRGRGHRRDLAKVSQISVDSGPDMPRNELDEQLVQQLLENGLPNRPYRARNR